MSGSILLSPKRQFLDAEGTPLAGGFVHVYLAGTTTRTNTWQDKLFATLNTNPIELDASGSCLMYGSEALTYKLVVTDANLASQPHLDADNVLIAGSSLVPVPINTVDTFSGTGVSSTYTLTVTPASKDETEVFVGGAYQQKSSYILAGNQITGNFTAGVSNVEVVTTSIADMDGFLADLSLFSQSAGDAATAAAASATSADASEAQAAAFAAQAAALAALIGAGGSFLEKCHIHDYATFGTIATIPDTVNAITKVYFGTLFIGPDLAQYTPATPTPNQVTLAADLAGVSTVYIFYI